MTTNITLTYPTRAGGVAGYAVNLYTVSVTEDGIKAIIPIPAIRGETSQGTAQNPPKLIDINQKLQRTWVIDAHAAITKDVKANIVNLLLLGGVFTMTYDGDDYQVVCDHYRIIELASDTNTNTPQTTEAADNNETKFFYTINLTWGQSIGS